MASVREIARSIPSVAAEVQTTRDVQVATVGGEVGSSVDLSVPAATVKTRAYADGSTDQGTPIKLSDSQDTWLKRQANALRRFNIRRRDSSIQLGVGGGLAATAATAAVLITPGVREVVLLGAAAAAAVVAVDAAVDKVKLKIQASKARDLEDLTAQEDAKIQMRANRNKGRYLPAQGEGADGSMALVTHASHGVVDRRWLPFVPLYRRVMITPVSPETGLPTGQPDVVERTLGPRHRAVRKATNLEPFGTGSPITDNDRVIGAPTVKNSRLGMFRFDNPILGRLVFLYTEQANKGTGKVRRKLQDITPVIFARTQNVYEIAAARVRVKSSGRAVFSEWKGIGKRIQRS